MATGVAERAIRRRALATMILGLVCHTSRKNLGRLRRASSRCLNVSGSVGCPFLFGEVLPAAFLPEDRASNFIRILTAGCFQCSKDYLNCCHVKKVVTTRGRPFPFRPSLVCPDFSCRYADRPGGR